MYFKCDILLNNCYDNKFDDTKDNALNQKENVVHKFSTPTLNNDGAIRTDNDDIK